MPIELMAIKIGDALVPATSADHEIIKTLKQRQAIRVTLTRVTSRSLNNHKLYWGGLIRLLADYWEAKGGLISVHDKKVMAGLVRFVEKNAGDASGFKSVISTYLKDRAERASEALASCESAAATLMDIHTWLKLEAGYYDAVLTPTGVIKQVKSINFDAMKTEEEFLEFYKKAFSVAWRYVFSKNGFSSQEEAEGVALEMISMSR